MARGLGDLACKTLYLLQINFYLSFVNYTGHKSVVIGSQDCLEVDGY